jgi:hypothetical protein
MLVQDQRQEHADADQIEGAVERRGGERAAMTRISSPARNG